MVKTADAGSFLSVSLVGDICEYSMQPLNSMTSSSITKLYSSTQDKYRVDDFSYNSAKDTLLVGFLGRKEGKEMESPPNQVVLYKREVNNVSVDESFTTSFTRMKLILDAAFHSHRV